ncbi:DUF444 family protein [Desulfosediminicola flagellatus]|uniref:DUF444 family protein n=1 Tax=Desulfosediminicola flagellatus TaxID=2569541 RepID=UPI0010ACBCAE|nr:DUF444 family protein [Desulfosediminicola flagellatus]
MKKLRELYKEYKKKGLTPEQDSMIERELEMVEGGGDITLIHQMQDPVRPLSLYGYNDMMMFENNSGPEAGSVTSVHSLDYLLEKDSQREKDGFPRKIRVGKMVKPGGDGDDKVVVVPSTVEEKLIHDRINLDEEGEGEGEGVGEGGSGEGEEGEVIGEQPVRQEKGEGTGAGQGDAGSHEIEANAYDLGRVLTEQFKLPNLRDKGKKRSLTRYTYDLTDKNRGFGQVLDKKSTLRQVIQTNIALGRIKQNAPIDTTGLLMSPRDRVYRILSKEKDYESQAVVFFVRDYSGSMSGKPTELVVNQHVLIYSWLIFQYEKQVETRFILHDTEAKEVEDFNTYYNSKVAGGTQVSAAYKLVNKIVEEESLEKDYNIYIFHGTDGDDWDTRGDEAIPEMKKMLKYAARIGVTIAENGYGISGKTEVETYLRKSGMLEEFKQHLRLDVLGKDSTETRLIDGIKKLIS